MSGGVASIGSWLAVGRGGDNGNLYVSGGSLTVATNNLTIASFIGNQGQVTVTGGTVNAVNSIYVGESGTGTMAVSGSGVVRATSLYVGTNGSANGTYTQSGGLLNAATIVVGNQAGSTGASALPVEPSAEMAA